MVAVESNSKSSFSVLSRQKGRKDGYVVAAFIVWLLSLGALEMELRTDGEPAIVDFCRFESCGSSAN
jgi:hypothetical protein